MIGRQGMRNILQHNRFTGPRWRHHKGTLAFADGRDQIHDAAGFIFVFRIIDFHDQAFIGIKGRKVVKVCAMTNSARIFEIDQVQLHQGEITFPFFGRPNFALDRVSGAQTKAPHLIGRYINIIRTGKIVGLWGS